MFVDLLIIAAAGITIGWLVSLMSKITSTIELPSKMPEGEQPPRGSCCKEFKKLDANFCGRCGRMLKAHCQVITWVNDQRRMLANRDAMAPSLPVVRNDQELVMHIDDAGNVKPLVLIYLTHQKG